MENIRNHTRHTSGDVQEDGSLNYCPNVWFQPKTSDDFLFNCENCIWEFCFLCFCLPLCYPCYLSRHWRKHVKYQKIKDRICLQKQQQFIQIYKKKENNHAKFEEVVNVIFLHSKSSISLLSNLKKEKGDQAAEYPISKQEISKQGEKYLVKTGKPLADCCAKHKEKKTFKKITQNILKSKLFIKSTRKSNKKTRKVRKSSSSESEIFYSASSSLSDTTEHVVQESSTLQKVASWLESCEPFVENVKNKNDNYISTLEQNSEHESMININHTKVFLKQSTAFFQENVISLDSSSHRAFLSEEGSLHDLPADDLQLVSGDKVSLLNIIIIVYGDEEELTAILNKTTGINGYIGKFWTGFFPLLIIQACSNPDTDCHPVPARESELIENKFSSCHRLVVHNMEDHNFLLESVVRYHLHLGQCRKRERSSSSSLETTDWKCSQQCGLRSCNYEKLDMEKSKKQNFWQVLRKNMTPSKLKRNAQNKTN